MSMNEKGLPTLQEVIAGINTLPTWPAHEPVPMDRAEPERPIHDPVHQPAHYQTDSGIECIDAIRAALGREGFIAYCRGSAMKYAWRAGKKGCAGEDMAKAAKYSQWAAQA